MKGLFGRKPEKPPELDSIEEAPLYIDRNGGLYVDPDELVASKRFGQLLEDAAKLDIANPDRKDNPEGA